MTSGPAVKHGNTIFFFFLYNFIKDLSKQIEINPSMFAQSFKVKDPCSLYKLTVKQFLKPWWSSGISGYFSFA